METDPEPTKRQPPPDGQIEEMEQEEMEQSARSARRRLWAADVARYYAQKRYNQTEAPKDRQIWEGCQRKFQEAAAAVREAERILVD